MAFTALTFMKVSYSYPFVHTSCTKICPNWTSQCRSPSYHNDDFCNSNSNSNIHLFSVNLITRYGKSHISNSKSYSQLSSMYTRLRDEIVIVIIEIL